MNKRIIAIGLLFYVNVLGFAVLIPVLPFVLENFGMGAIEYGVLLSLYPLFQFIGAPFLGTLSDHFGRRPLLLISQFGTMLSWVIVAGSYFIPSIDFFGLPLPLFVFGLARIVDGITGGNFSVASAYIADITPRENRTKIFGLLGAIVGVGLITGPVLGGFLNSTPYGYFAVALFSCVLSLVTLILMYLFLSESLSAENRKQGFEFHLVRELNIIGKIRKYNESNYIPLMFLIRAFFALAFSSYTSTIVLLMKDKFELNSAMIGLLFLLFGLYVIVNQSIIAPRMAKRFGEFKIFYYGQVIFILGLLLLAFVQNMSVLLIAVYFTNLGFSTVFPTFKTLITGAVSQQEQGTISGIDESVMAGGSAIAPLLGSFIYKFTGQLSYAIFILFVLLPHIIIYLRTKKFIVKLV